MSAKQGSSKKKRDKKVSRGEHGGAQKVRLDEIQKVSLGGGLLVNTDKTTRTGHKWLGAEGVPEPYDPEQVKINRRLYPHLFTGR